MLNDRPSHRVESRIFWLVFIGGPAIILYLAVAVFGVQALFTNNEVSDDFAVFEQQEAPISYVLRLENLNIDNGPDLFVYAVTAGDARNSPLQGRKRIVFFVPPCQNHSMQEFSQGRSG